MAGFDWNEVQMAIKKMSDEGLIYEKDGQYYLV